MRRRPFKLLLTTVAVCARTELFTSGRITADVVCVETVCVRGRERKGEDGGHIKLL